jgi:hypothetical protein
MPDSSGKHRDETTTPADKSSDLLSSRHTELSMHFRPQQLDECLACAALCAFFYLLRAIVGMLQDRRDKDDFPSHRPRFN